MRDRTVSADDHAGPHLRPDPSRADTGGRGSVGSRGDSYDSLAETVNGLYKAELIYRAGPWGRLALSTEPGPRPGAAPWRQSPMDQPSRVIVMKVGVHLGEPWEAIVERKLAEVNTDLHHDHPARLVHWGLSPGGG